MKQDYPPCEDRVLAHEGSTYTDGVHPYDPGGPTRWGITIEDARLYWKPAAKPDDVRTMPVEVAKQIYKTKYWDRVRGDDLLSGIDDTVFDYGVNSGVGRAGKVLRRVVGMPDNTSIITQDVLAACARRDPKAVIKAVNDERLRFLQSLAIWPTYKNGWTTRVREVTAFSLALADGAAQPTTTITANDASPVDLSAKGKVPAPVAAKNLVKSSAPIVAAEEAARDGGGWIDWIAAHPIETGIIAVCVVVLVIVAINALTRWHKAKQEAPTPGLLPVPETKTI